MRTFLMAFQRPPPPDIVFSCNAILAPGPAFLTYSGGASVLCLSAALEYAHGLGISLRESSAKSVKKNGHPPRAQRAAENYYHFLGEY